MGRKAYSDIGKPFLQNAIMSDTYKHLRSARKSANLTQESIAKACGVSRNAVTQWESLNPSTRTEPSIDNLKIISTLTGVAVSALIGQDVFEQSANYRVNPDHSETIPLISWQQANKKVDSVTSGENIFALKVQDSAMTAPAGVTPSFPKGYVIHVDLEQIIANNDYVIARIKGQQELTFKQLRADGGKQYLHSLDPSLPNIFEKFELIGKVVAANIEL